MKNTNRHFLNFIPWPVACMLCICTILISCTDTKKESASTKTLFTLLRPGESGIHFANKLQFDPDFNIYTYRNFYNGGGVAIGDINHDSLPDIYFTANMGANKLYLNKGELTFEDITHKAGAEGRKGAWSTGVTMADVNGDGWLDIYVCHSGEMKGDSRRNE